MAGVSHDRDVVPALSPDLLANLGVVLGCGPIVVHGEVGAGTTRGDTYTFVVPPGVVASDATLRALIAAARQQSSTVTSLAAAELAIVPAGLDVLAAIDVHACGGEAMGDVEQTAPAALLAPGTAFDVRDGEVVWQGPGVRVPDARVATRATSFRTGPMTGAARPVFRRALVVAVVAAPWTQRLIDWVAAHRGDRSLALRVLGPAEGSPPDCAPADDLGSLVELRPDVVIADIDHVPAGLGDALAPLSRTVVVTVDDGAACVSRDPGGRVRGTLGVDLDRDATVAALARWASGPSVGGPVIISPDVPGGSHVRHPMPRLAAPVRTVGLHANGGHSHDRFVALAAACSGMPDLATSVVPLESDRLPDVLFVGGPLGPALDEVAGAVRAGVGVALDLYGTDASADLAKLPSDVRRRLLLLTPGHATRRRLAQAFGVPVHVLPAVSTGQDPLPVGSGGTLVLGVATGTDVNERALAACAARAAAPVDLSLIHI